MADSRKSGVLAALQIRPEEVKRTGLLFLYLFLVSVVFTTGRTARDALYLSNFPDAMKWLPYMFIGFGAGSAAIIPLYTRLVDKFRRDRFNAVYALILAVTYLAAWVMVRMKWQPIYPALYIWVEITSNLLIVQFWTLTNDLHDPREAKRLFGVIGSSRMIGIVVCGLGVSVIVGMIGTPSLLLGNAIILALIAVVTTTIGKNFLAEPQVARVVSARTDAGARVNIWRSGYVLLIIAMIVATFISATLADFQFKGIAKATYSGEKLAAFFALFYVVVGVLAFFFHFFVSSRILSRFGLLFGLLVMPLCMGLSSAALLITAGALAAAAAIKLSDNAFQFTINDSALQLLYYPFPGRIKARLKATLEGAVKPLSYGLGGVALILLAGPLGKVGLSWVVLPVIGLWIVTLVFLRGYYVKALINSLNGRRLEPGGIDLMATPEVVSVLKQAARTDNNFVFEFAFNELAKLDAGEARAVADELLSLPERRQDALRHLEELGAEPGRIQPLLADPDPTNRAAAIRTLASILHEDGIDRIVPFLSSSVASDHDAAISALMRHAGLEGILAAGAHLQRLLEGDADARARAARVLGDIRVREFYRPIRRLLDDADPEVRVQAILAAGRIGNRYLTRRVIEFLPDPHYRRFAIEALENYGERALEPLVEALGDQTLPVVARERLPRLIRRINRPDVVNALWAFAGVDDERLRIPILHHGERLQEKWSLALDRRRVGELLRLEGETAARWLSRWKNFQLWADDRLLAEALDQAIYWCGRRTFSLLRLLYGADAIGRIRYNIESADSSLRAGALETLDNLLEQEERNWILPLFDASDRGAAAAAVPARFPRGKETVAQSVAAVLSERHPFLSAALFRARSLGGAGGEAEEIEGLAPYASALLLEELARAARKQGRPEAVRARAEELKDDRALAILDGVGAKEDVMLTTLDRVLFLKRVPLFARVPGEDLVRLAQVADIEDFAAGQDIFRQGEPGDSMYLVVTGSVSINISGREVARVRSEECFGEMAILDRQPRSASVAAVESSTVLKITQEDFFEIMADRPEIAQGVIEVLTSRLRKADEEIHKLANKK